MLAQSEDASMIDREIKKFELSANFYECLKRETTDIVEAVEVLAQTYSLISKNMKANDLDVKDLVECFHYDVRHETLGKTEH